MNLFLRPLNDVNDVTWSIIWSMVILLFGVGYYIYTIMKMAYEELEDADRHTEHTLPIQSEGDTESS
jgi:hypothetical protein